MGSFGHAAGAAVGLSLAAALAATAPACEGGVGGPSPEPDGGAGAAAGTAGTAAAGSGGNAHGGSGGSGGSGAQGGGGGPACASDCTVEGQLGCNADETEVVECLDVGSPAAPCLRWQTVEACESIGICQDEACVLRCCTPDGAGCCSGSWGGDCCDEADDCLLGSVRNGSELCDDEHRAVDPSANRYFLVCLNANEGIGYVATNSGPACGSPTIPRCQCWEQQGDAPWDYLDYVAQMTCDQVGKRIEVSFPEAGHYYVGAHPPPGDYPLNGYCPTGDGCMTCVGLLEIPY